MRSFRRAGRGADERGAITAVTALGMTTLLGAAAIAIDLGHLYNVRGQSQQVADAAALAAAGAFVNATGGTVANTARVWGIGYAAQNGVNGATVTILPADIDVNAALDRVDLNVHNSAARGTAVASLFARVLGVAQTDIVTAAAAQAFPASGVHCALPLFIVDRWDELGGSPGQFDPGIDYYEPYDPAAPSSTYTGYDESDIGTALLLEPAPGPPAAPGQPEADWYYPFDATNLPGGGGYLASILGCPSPGVMSTLGQRIWIEPGASPGTTLLGMSSLIGMDPSAVWEPILECVVDAGNLGSGNPAHCRSSPRLRPVAAYDPGTAPVSGTQQVTVANLAGVFVDGIVGTEIAVILTGYGGVDPIGAPAAGVTPSMLKVVRLVR